MWQSFCKAIGNPALAKQKEFATLADRKKNEDRLEEIVTAWTKQHTHQEVQDILQKAGVAVHMVSRPSDVYLDEQLKARNYWVPLQHEVMGLQKWEPQSCFIMSKTPRQIKMPSPLLGQHNEYVFKELLKMSDDEIAEHIIDGSITTSMDAPLGLLKVDFLAKPILVRGAGVGGDHL